jgi:CheY-like chemotaxis protein
MTKALRVMSVEDDPDIRMILQFSLATVGGFEVLLCCGGEQALVTGPAFKPDLILLDVMMPGFSGPQTLAALRQQRPLQRVPVVFMTAKAMPDEVVSLLAFGATGVIVKPFDPMKLPQDVRMFWEHGRSNATT